MASTLSRITRRTVYPERECAALDHTSWSRAKDLSRLSIFICLADYWSDMQNVMDCPNEALRPLPARK